MFPPLLISPFLLAEKTIGDTKSHFELTLAISKKLAEMQKKLQIGEFYYAIWIKT